MTRLSDRETRSSREQVLHQLYEAAELEHCLMCTYLYAAFSLRTDDADGLLPDQLAATRRWRDVLLQVAIEEMGHLVAVWNITSALGGAPRIGRFNLPLDPGALPASVVVKLAPFDESTLQHFIFLERPAGSDEKDGDGFALERAFSRGAPGKRITPMAMDYETVGTFYAAIGQGLRDLVDQWGEATTFCGDPALQLTAAEAGLPNAARVICSKTALAAFDAIVAQGEGAPNHVEGSHYQKFVAIRSEFAALRAQARDFQPAHPAATNPVLRSPPRAEGRVRIEDPLAVAVVDLASSCYGLMLRLLAHAYAVRSGEADKTLSLDLAVGLMHALVPLAELAARLPAVPGASVNAGVSFIALRDAAALPPGPSARRMFCERFEQIADAAELLSTQPHARAKAAHEVIARLAARALAQFDLGATAPKPADAGAAVPASAPVAAPAAAAAAPAAPAIEVVEADDVTLMFEGRRCIHARFCVTGAPTVFLANVQGPWLHPETLAVDRLVEVAHACPSGAIRYARKDGKPGEPVPPVNLARVREAGPYAFHGELRIDGQPAGYRATLCRCGASKNKPFCDGSHHDVAFAATGEPATTGDTAMLAQRDGPLAIDPQRDGPLRVRGNLEIVSGTGRMVSRMTDVRLCRCGGSANKPFCDGTHARIGFKS
ncbi:MAG: ferritin-like domain-containing protein [Dokdonella sp.]|uniref:ferritin-like domain-containing protein n=1 Tax=Dokdonella sp. TaxID=2291710 RepID=UPI003F7E1D29